MVVTAPHPARFQPTLPARGATATTRRERSEIWYFNPRSPHGERRSLHDRHLPRMRISTHAPRTGSDGQRLDARGLLQDFNPRSPHGERWRGKRPRNRSCNFNPRSPHGERRDAGEHVPRIDAISTHAPRTGSDVQRTENKAKQIISTHAPRTGSDPLRKRRRKPEDYFNPRSPHGERRKGVIHLPRQTLISTHAPRTGSDNWIWARCYFNS